MTSICNYGCRESNYKYLNFPFRNELERDFQVVTVPTGTGNL